MALENDTRPIDELTFKEASVELEQVVRSLEGGDLELEAEQRVQVLLDATDADVTPDTTAAPSTAFIDDKE